MNKKSRDFILEPKQHVNKAKQVISIPKVLGVAVSVVFFVNIGFFIYENKNPIEVSPYNVDKVKSPYAEGETPTGSPFASSKLSKDYQNTINTMPDVKGVFDQKTSKDGNLPPIAKAKLVTTSYDQGYIAGDTVFLSAIDSYDPDGIIKEFRWDFDQSNGLGIDAEGSTATVKFNNAGLYTVTLMVIDDQGFESTTSLTIPVAEKKPDTPNNLLALSTDKIDLDQLNFDSRIEIQNAVEKSFADFQSSAVSSFAQAIYSSQKKNLPPLPTLDEIELSVGQDPSNTPPVVDSTNPKEGADIYDQKPIISAGFYGNNEVDISSIELMVDGVPVTDKAMKSKFGVSYEPSEELSFGMHSAMLVLKDSRGLKTTKSWNFEIVDPTANNDSIAPGYKDDQGPQIILHSPDKNAKNVDPTKDIKVNFDEPANPKATEIAVVDLSTNITKFFSGTQIQWNSSYTGFVISANQKIFDYNTAYQIVVKTADEAGNQETHDWYIMGEEYDAPEFTITAPTNKSTVNEPKITITGFADPSYRIFVDDEVAMVDARGSFKATISLDKGDNEILVKSKDLNGKESEQILTITYDPSANGGNPIYDPQTDGPIIMDASIKDGEVVKPVRPQISFVFADTDGIDIKSIVLKVDGKDVTNFAFITKDDITYKPLEELEQGNHTIQLIIADTLGNTTDYNMKFTIDAYPEVPTNLTASLTNNNESVLLLWDGVTNISKPEYRVFRSLNPNVALTAANEVKRGLADTTWTDNSVITGTTYYYVVAAVNDAGNLSHPSNEVKITVDNQAPRLQVFTPEKNLKVDVPKTTLTGFVDINDLKTLEIFVNFKSVGEPTIADNGTFEMELNLVEGDNVITTVATDSDGNETVDVRTVTYVVPDTTPPKAVVTTPKGTRVSVTSDIVITYNEPMDASKFKMILKPLDSTETFIPITTNDIHLQVSDDKKTFTYNPPVDLEYVTTYDVQVRAYDLAGNESLDDDWQFETVDKKAPLLEVITPVVDYVSSDEYLYVSGNTEPNIDVSISVNGKVSEPVIKSAANGSFSKLIQLEPGKNLIAVTATDHLNHATTVEVPGIYDAPDLIPPELKVNNPEQNAVLDKETVTVSGYTEAGASLTISVNGKDQGTVVVNKNGSFSHKVNLLEGANLIKVVATDPAGNQTPVAINVRYDNQGPLLEVVNPVDRFTTNVGRIEVRGLTDEDSEHVEIRVGEDVYEPSINPDGTFNQFVRLGKFNNLITVTATDIYGNKTKRVRNVYYDPVGGSDGSLDSSGTDGKENESGSLGDPDSEGLGGSTDVIDPDTGDQNWTGGDHTPPPLSVQSSEGLLTDSKTTVIHGKTEPEARVTVIHNGKQVATGESHFETGEFETVVNLQQGMNSIIVKSEDVSGNKTTKNITVERDDKAPHLQILAPVSNAIVKDSHVYVYGTSEPKSEVYIQVEGERGVKVKTDELGYFNTRVPVGSENATTHTQVSVTVKDALGNETTKIVPIIVDRTKIELVISSLNDIRIENNKVSSNKTQSYIKGTVDTGDYSGEVTLTAYTDGKQTGVLRMDANRKSNFKLDVLIPPSGSAEIRVEAKDSAGNITTKEFSVHGDSQAPKVNVYIPEAYDAITDKNVKLVGKATDNSEGYSTVKMTLNGSSTPFFNRSVKHGDSFTTSVSNLEEGVNTVLIEARDSVGNELRQFVYIIYSSKHGKPLATLNMTKPDKPNFDLDDALDNAEDHLDKPLPDKPQVDKLPIPPLKDLDDIFDRISYSDVIDKLYEIAGSSYLPSTTLQGIIIMIEQAIGEIWEWFKDIIGSLVPWGNGSYSIESYNAKNEEFKTKLKAAKTPQRVIEINNEYSRYMISEIEGIEEKFTFTAKDQEKLDSMKATLKKGIIEEKK